MKIEDYKEYYCLALTELVRGMVCHNRKTKANIATHNKKFTHRMDPFTLKACTKCKGGSEGLIVPGEQSKEVVI
ncbi:MAG: hypothetical protein JRE23_00170 [Deltaproteobacteria bacterium]|nr:hypothetical protein [Deltaproteobacteria bacterium]